jgi:dUTP pyrophosphatase
MSPEGSDETLRVLVRRLDADLPLPRYAHPGDAGADLVARDEVRLGPGERAVVPTGIAVALPWGYAAFVHPRSGLAARHGVTIVNAPGTIDAGYRGEICVNLVNTDREAPVTIHRGDRIAQLVVQRVERAGFRATDELSDSVRGDGGHGSTGGFAGGPTTGPSTTEPSTAGPSTTGPAATRPAATGPSTTEPSTTAQGLTAPEGAPA